jgi:hypothetical protein
MWDGSDLSTVPGLDKSPTQEAENSRSDHSKFHVGLGVRGLPFSLLLCMFYLSCSRSLSWSRRRKNCSSLNSPLANRINNRCCSRLEIDIGW